jgi:hypothetical protein
MNEIGPVEKVRNVTKKDALTGQQFTVDFKDYKSAVDSLVWNGADIRGRPVKIVPNDEYREQK